MNAVRIHQHGGIDRLQFETIDEPVLRSSTEAIVRLEAAALNAQDVRVRRGLGGKARSLPLTPGADGAGVVVEVGAGVRNLKVGDRVCLYPPLSCGACEWCMTDRDTLCPEFHPLGDRVDGTYAEYVALPARNCFPVPAGLSLRQAAALPSSYLSAWRMLMTDAQLKPGESVLIRATADGLGAAALEIARHAGARTFVAGGADTLERARRLGADDCVRDDTGDLARTIREMTDKRGVDVVLDALGGEGWRESLACLARTGRLVTSGAAVDAHPQTNLRRVFWNHLTILGSIFGSRQDFRQMLTFVEASRVRPAVDGVFPLRAVAEAHAQLESGRAFGKLLLSMGE